ncbi:ankyrin repeat domain-containing protein [Mycoavidus sp. B2-EB]|uniref:ankyrin repeat domain-containing protein n=1 Tax=Mycoavidus sp. B2-EB TaxID=2651972 RepID=UPI0016288CF8|nr:ankyrin repeat domain-containing protein [Mycoavidus sp. B2-EB]BBO60011.1 hypothetical protein MPB2EB_1146 [Mycoavidus sp. B2-EB]
MLIRSPSLSENQSSVRFPPCYENPYNAIPPSYTRTPGEPIGLFRKLKQSLKQKDLNRKLLKEAKKPDGKIQKIEALVTSGADISTKSAGENTALHYACETGNSELVERLIELGADIEAANNLKRTPLHTAASAGQTNSMAKLFLYHANPHAENRGRDTPLIIAERKGHREAIRLLKEYIEESAPLPPYSSHL